MSPEEFEELGPIDYLIVEWPDHQPSGEAAPLLADLVDRGLIRIIDLAFIAKGEDSSVTLLDIAALADESGPLGDLVGASSGLLSRRTPRGGDGARTRDVGRGPHLREPLGGTVRRRASPLRRSAGRKRRIPVQALLAALDAAEGSESTT